MRIDRIGLLSLTILGAAMTLGWSAEPDLQAEAAANQGLALPPKTVVVPAPKAPDFDDLTRYGGCSDCAPSHPQTPLQAGAAANQGLALPPKTVVVPASKALRAGGSKLSISREVALPDGIHGGNGKFKLKTMPKMDRSVHVRLQQSRSPAIAKLPDAGRGSARSLVAHPAGLDTLHAKSSLPKTVGGNFNAAKSLQSSRTGGFNTSMPTHLSGGAGSFHAPKVSAMDALSNSNFGNKSIGGSADKFRRPK
jgi:hypothetical protein